ncbi:MAG: arginase family protein [Candidatus Aenigmatarchaeota archaeon]
MQNKFCLNLVSEEEADIVIFGALLGKNSKKVLSSLRKTSWFLEWFDVDREKNLIEEVKVVDIGDVKVERGNEIEEVIKKILSKKKIPFMLSESHLATYFALKAFDEVKVVSFDAHFDVKNSYIDEKMVDSIFPLNLNEEEIKRLNRATWVRRSFEEGKSEFCFVGVRSGDEFDLEFVKEKKMLYFTSKMIRENFQGVKQKLRKFCKNNKIYLTIDIDAFDPSVAPAVGHPEPDGIFWFQFQELLKEVFKGKVVGLDLVEIEPMGSKVTEFLATKIIFESLFLLKSVK